MGLTIPETEDCVDLTVPEKGRDVDLTVQVSK